MSSRRCGITIEVVHAYQPRKGIAGDGGNAVDIDAVGFCGCDVCSELHAEYRSQPSDLAARSGLYDLDAVRGRKQAANGVTGGSPVWKSLSGQPTSVKKTYKPLSKLFLHFSLASLQLLLALLLMITLLIASKSTASNSGWPALLDTTPMSSDIAIYQPGDCLVCPEEEMVDCV